MSPRLPRQAVSPRYPVGWFLAQHMAVKAMAGVAPAGGTECLLVLGLTLP